MSNIRYDKFGSTIKHIRTTYKHTQQKVCDTVGISNTHYSNIENGVAKPSLEVLVSLANYFDLSLSSILMEGKAGYGISYDIKSMFTGCSDTTVMQVLDILAYAKAELYSEE